MQTSGRLISILPTRTGEKKTGGTWKTCDVVVEQDTKNKDKILLTAWGDAVDDLKGKENQQVEVGFSISAREYKSKWYNSCAIWKLRFPELYNDVREEPDMNQEASEVPNPPDDNSLPF